MKKGSMSLLLIAFGWGVLLPAAACVSTAPKAPDLDPGFCMECHQRVTPGLFQSWVESKHARMGVHCMTCHIYHQVASEQKSMVFPEKCGECHSKEVEEFRRSRHLPRDAEVDTKSQLEIYADDVKCSHGTTVGQLDAQQIFFLRSRGIDEVTARSMLCLGFAGSIIDTIKIPALHELASRKLVEILHATVTMTDIQDGNQTHSLSRQA